jgi:hypothetical protein
LVSCTLWQIRINVNHVHNEQTGAFNVRDSKT